MVENLLGAPILNELILERLNSKITNTNKKIISNLKLYINQYNNMAEKPHKDFFFYNMPKKLKAKLGFHAPQHLFIVPYNLINKKFCIKLQITEENDFFNLNIFYTFKKDIVIDNLKYLLRIELKEETGDTILSFRGRIENMSRTAFNSIIRGFSYNFNAKTITPSHFAGAPSEGVRISNEALLTTFNNIYSTKEELKDILALEHDLYENIYPYLTINKILTYILTEKKEEVKTNKISYLLSIIKEKINSIF